MNQDLQSHVIGLMGAGIGALKAAAKLMNAKASTPPTTEPSQKILRVVVLTFHSTAQPMVYRVLGAFLDQESAREAWRDWLNGEYGLTLTTDEAWDGAHVSEIGYGYHRPVLHETTL